MSGEDQGSQELLLEQMGRLNSHLVAQHRQDAATVHDLAGPAQVMLGLSEVLLEHPSLDPFVRARIEQLHRSATTMASLVGDLNRGGLSLDDPQRLELRPLDLGELVASVVVRSRVLAGAKRIDLLLLDERPASAACWVDGDAVKLERALGNLIGNAVKFSPEHSRVSVAVDRGVDHVAIAVRDEGPGIPEEDQERVFEVFHRAAAAAGIPGRGLGLYITRQIVAGHGGRVSVRCGPGPGSTFLMEIPLADAA